MMSRRACFHANETWLKLRKEWDHLVATQQLDENNLVILIDAVHLEDVLGEIDTDGLNLLL